MSEFMVAAVQVSPGEEVPRNLERAGGLVEEAAAKGARLVVLPEMFGGVFPQERWTAISEAPGGPTEAFLSEAARQNRIYVVGGSYIEDAGDGRYFNTCPVLADDGSLVGRYRKMHLFWTDIPGKTKYDEREVLSAGDCRFYFDVAGFRVAVGICYDLRFPEFFRGPGMEPPDIYCLGAAFMKATGEAHWEALLRARAIENLAYFVAAGTVGRHYEVAGRPGEMVETYGHSMVVSPWGEVLTRVDEGEGISVAEVSRDRLDQARARLGALEHMRSDLWRPRPS